MKTNVLMKRKMGTFEVTQRTKDSMFNATDLLKQWNESSGQQKQMIHFTELKSTKEFIEAIKNDEISKERNSVLIKTRGKNGGTWMQPYLFIDFAMWINPTFKLQVIKFVHDEMIKYRNDAGEAYKELSSSISSIVPKKQLRDKIQKVSRALNHIVFGDHETGIRNKYGNEDKQRELFQLENKVSDLINEGFISNFNNLENYLRKLWKNKYMPI